MVIVLSRSFDYYWKWLAKYFLINHLQKLSLLELFYILCHRDLRVGYSYFFIADMIFFPLLSHLVRKENKS